MSEESFLELKCRLTSALVLVIPSSTGGFQVYNDTSYLGLGCVFMQYGRVVAYGLRQLKTHEKNYPAHDLGLIAIYLCSQIWRHYLQSETSKTYIEHKSLMHLFT